MAEKNIFTEVRKKSSCSVASKIDWDWKELFGRNLVYFPAYAFWHRHFLTVLLFSASAICIKFNKFLKAEKTFSLKSMYET